MLTSEIKLLPLTELKPYDKNSKAHPQEQVKRIARSIERYGFDQPIVIDAEGEIIKGHGRRLAAEYLGMKEVPVVVNPLPKDEARAARIADNKSAESDWLLDELQAEIKELRDSGFDIEDSTGFTSSELDALFAELEAGNQGDSGSESGEDEALDPGEVEPRCKLGEVWQLGRHRLMVGDSTDEGAIALLLEGRKPKMIFADPPYGISIVATSGYVGGGEAYDIPFGGVKNRKGYVGGGTV